MAASTVPRSAHIDHLDALIDALDEQIDVGSPLSLTTCAGCRPSPVWAHHCRGVDRGDRCRHGRVPDSEHLASWCGVCPGNNESVGKQRSGRTNPASPSLTDALVQAAWAATRSQNTWLSARFWRLANKIRQEESHHRDRARDRYRGLAHAHQPLRLHRSRHRLVGQQGQHHQRDRPPQPTPRSPRAPRHSRTRGLDHDQVNLPRVARSLKFPTL